MKMRQLANELGENAYPGRGIVIGKTPDGKLVSKKPVIPTDEEMMIASDTMALLK